MENCVTTEQLSLQLTAPFQRHSNTSKDAARSIEPNAGTLLAKVYDYLRLDCKHGATDEELQQWIPMAASTQRPRRVWLVQHGFVRDSGRKAQTTSGRMATIWECVR